MRDANKSRRREREVPFYATREKRRKKREAREHTHTYAGTCPRVYAFTRVHASVARSVCTGRKRTYVQRESREARARDKDGEREKGGKRGRDRETDRVYVPPEECTRLLVL